MSRRDYSSMRDIDVVLYSGWIKSRMSRLGYRERKAKERVREPRIAFLGMLNPLDDLREESPRLARHFWVKLRLMSKPEQQLFAAYFLALHDGKRSEEIKTMIKLARAPRKAWVAYMKQVEAWNV